MPRVHYLPDNKDISLEPNETILAASLRSGIPHTSACGGHARCSTCRVLILEGLEHCSPRNESETAMAQRLHFTPEIRLACQTTINGDVTLRRLALDAEDVQLIAQTVAAPPPDLSIGEEKTLAILFSDIRGFTSFSEKLPPYDVIHTLNRYFDVMGKVIADNGGCIDNYMGDGLMALFGIEHGADAPFRAVKAGLEMLQAMEGFKPYLKSLYNVTFEIGVGVHVGEVVVGTLGAPGHRRTTAIGDAVNFASRIESANKNAKTRFLISADTHALTKDKIQAGKVIDTNIAGKSGVYQLFEVVGLK